MTDAFIVRTDETRPTRPGPGATHAFLADGTETGGALECAVTALCLCDSLPMHLHPDQDEAVFVLEGTIGLHIDGEHHTLSAGDVAFIPWGIAHAMTNPEPTAARALIVCTPGGLFEFCRAMMDHPAARFKDLAVHAASRWQPAVGPLRCPTNPVHDSSDSGSMPERSTCP